MAPLRTGAAGTRNMAASSTISATWCCSVQASMTGRNSAGAGDTGAGAVELGVVDEIRPLDHRQAVVPLLRSQGRQPDEAVLAGLDARNHFDRRPAADTPGDRAATDG